MFDRTTARRRVRRAKQEAGESTSERLKIAVLICTLLLGVDEKFADQIVHSVSVEQIWNNPPATRWCFVSNLGKHYGLNGLLEVVTHPQLKRSTKPAQTRDSWFRTGEQLFDKSIGLDPLS